MSRGEAELGLLLKINNIKYLQEYRFHPVRRWRFDFVILPEDMKIAVEVEGGVFSGGRHTRGYGYTKDAEKYNQATLMGWRVLRYTTAQINIKTIEEIKELIRYVRYTNPTQTR